MVNEEKLLKRLKKKAKNSIDEAIEIYTPYVSTVLYNIAGTALPREDIEEIVSDVFISLWRNAENIDLNKGTIRSYLAASARNFALKRLNKRKEYTSLDDVELPDKSDFADSSAESDYLWNAVMKLGEPDNEIFVRFYKYDEKLKDISKATGLKLSTVKTKLSRGKQKLRKILSETEELL
ncbi:MAG: sigma-70 family RNA polymerase sigma factor [bacterium]|nr:sigma-70 family RNA polymerase sigma factor [bacterium]